MSPYSPPLSCVQTTSRTTSKTGDGSHYQLQVQPNRHYYSFVSTFTALTFSYSSSAVEPRGSVIFSSQRARLLARAVNRYSGWGQTLTAAQQQSEKNYSPFVKFVLGEKRTHFGVILSDSRDFAVTSRSAVSWSRLPE